MRSVEVFGPYQAVFNAVDVRIENPLNYLQVHVHTCFVNSSFSEFLPVEEFRLKFSVKIEDTIS